MERYSNTLNEEEMAQQDVTSFAKNFSITQLISTVVIIASLLVTTYITMQNQREADRKEFMDYIQRLELKILTNSNNIAAQDKQLDNIDTKVDQVLNQNSTQLQAIYELKAELKYKNGKNE